MTDENSLFEGATDQNVLPPEEDNTSQNYLEDLVGEGKKFKSPEDLARGKAESDRFIAKLQQELKEVREDLKERLAVEELSKKIDSLTASASNQHNQRADERDGESKNVQGMTQEEVQEYVQESIRKQEEVKSQSQNIAAVRAELHKKWGDGYVEKMQAKANSLGLGKDFATGMAATYPQAFINLMMDKEASGPVDAAPPPSSTRQSAFNRSTGRKYKDFEKLRKDHPDQYHSPQVQMEMHRLAGELGEDFYN